MINSYTILSIAASFPPLRYRSGASWSKGKAILIWTALGALLIFGAVPRHQDGPGRQPWGMIWEGTFSFCMGKNDEISLL